MRISSQVRFKSSVFPINRGCYWTVFLSPIAVEVTVFSTIAFGGISGSVKSWTRYVRKMCDKLCFFAYSVKGDDIYFLYSVSWKTRIMPKASDSYSSWQQDWISAWFTMLPSAVENWPCQQRGKFNLIHQWLCPEGWFNCT